ncbi:DUF5776 domain-containing protein [Staphylococcus pseudoxylosus]|uniref:DUF5776 domain-containing protein n=1 Tax=Staphylococcus pseudoxylosus TaxID=2282419 RepID=UPI00299072C3|nr:DUF5776 domain-containing protein [Staphylococcus pseudoxylosus]
MEKLLSIIVPVYNKAYFLETCIESINKLNINKDKIEAIFVDDCSSDNSLEIVESFATKYDFIKVIQLAENTGSPSEPRNVGMKNATGEYITFLDADDWLDPEGLPTLLNQAKDHHSDVAFGQSVKHTEKAIKKIGRFSSYKNDNHLVPYEIEKIFRAVGPPGKIIKRDIIINNKIYFKHMKYGEDKLFFIEAISKCKTASMNPKPTYHVNRYTYNQSLVGQTDIIEKTKLNLTVLDEVLKLELPSNAEFQAISRIVEVDYMSRLFKNNRFLKAENKPVFYELFDEMVLMLASYGKNIEDYLLTDTFKNIYQFLKNKEYQKLIELITILQQGGKANKFVENNRVHFLMPETLSDALPIKDPVFAVYEGTHLIEGTFKDVIRVYKDGQTIIDKVILNEINNEIHDVTIDFEINNNYIYINTEDLNQCNFAFNISLIYDGYKSIYVNMNLPNASQEASLNRQNFKAEFVSATKSRNKADSLNEYLTYKPNSVSLVKKANLYEDVEFKQLAEETLEIGELVEIADVVETAKGTPRFITSDGYYLTANKKNVYPVDKDKEDKYIYCKPNDVTVLKKCKEYKNRNFEGEPVNILNSGDNLEIQKIVLSSKGTPRLKTNRGTFITANLEFVTET